MGNLISNGLKALVFAMSMLTLSACMTTSDISSLGDNTFAVSTLACPACGGTGKAEQMAIDAADSFCEEQGKMAVTQGIDVDSWDFNGAGTTDLAFKCVTPVSEDRLFACAQEHIDAAANELGEEVTYKTLGKLFSDENGFGFSELSDQAFPTETEKNVIRMLGEGYEECESIRLTAVSPTDMRALRSSANKRMALMAKLIASQITYGDYAAQSNVIDEALYATLSEIEKEAMQMRRAASKEASAKFNDAVQRSNQIGNSNKSTNCTSQVIGDSVYTNCF